jgi:thiamine-monophosphate kinase
MNEFELIDRFFRDCGARRRDVKLGVGDDAALLECPPGHELVASLDTLVEGRHFLADSPARSVGHRSLAVNITDLAAMGARPARALLARTMPRVDESWLADFASGFSKLALVHDVALVGGNTTSGPLCISVQILGHVPEGKALRRSGGKAGDILFVSGTPGDAAAGLALELRTTANAASAVPVSRHAPLHRGSTAHARADATGAARATADGTDAGGYLRERFLFPTPRVELGLRLRQIASACIDVSDGLFGDAAKLATASGCGLEISFEDVPASTQLVETHGEERARELALTGGEDYELCFSVSAASVAALERELPPKEWGYRRVGVLTTGSEHTLRRAGIVTRFSHSGFDHFAT